MNIIMGAHAAAPKKEFADRRRVLNMLVREYEARKECFYDLIRKRNHSGSFEDLGFCVDRASSLDLQRDYYRQFDRDIDQIANRMRFEVRQMQKDYREACLGLYYSGSDEQEHRAAKKRKELFGRSWKAQ